MGPFRRVRIILASKSPRRKVLLSYLLDDFLVDPVPVVEEAPHDLSISDGVCVIARKKALAASRKHPEDMVLAADTVVAHDGDLMGKARTQQQLRSRLQRLGGSTHVVWTGIALAWGEEVVDDDNALTSVHMEPLPEVVASSYAASGAWEGKAGGYGIQDEAMAPHLRIQAGPWSNVVGLPLQLTADLLRRNNIAVRDPPDEAWLREHNPF